MAELWKTVARDTRYEVSNFGRVRSYCRSSNPLIRKLTPTPDGHLIIVLRFREKPCQVHALVAEAFLPAKPFDGAEIRHLDGDGSNNRVENLEWGSRSQNIQDNKWQGKERKLTGQQAREIKRRLCGRNGAALAREFGVSRYTVSNIRTGRIHTDA